MSHRLLPSLLAGALLAGGVAAAHAYAESKVSCDTVPAAVLNQAKLDAPGATIHGCVKDKENGKLVYEVETLKDGKSKDMTFDPAGKTIAVEQEVDRESLPPAVSTALVKLAKGGDVGKIESVTRGGAIAGYETTIVRHGHSQEVAFRPDGNRMQPD